MRVFTSCVAIVLCAACGQPAPSAPPRTSGATPVDVNPVRVERVRTDLPAGYEVVDVAGRAAPVTLWGVGQGWTADPAQCGALADPAGNGAVHGWSASGPGGIVYAVVVDVVVAVAPVGLNPALADSCATWTLSAGHTSGVVTLVGAPPVEGAATLGMATDATSIVEGGTETHTHAETFIAYLGEHVAYVTVVTDPGASGPALRADFASDLLVKTVAAIRG